MSDLSQTLKNVKTTLDGVVTFLTGSNPVFTSSPGADWVKHWRNKLQFVGRLENAIEDLGRRNEAADALDGFLSDLSPADVVVAPLNNANYCGRSIAPERARYFLVANYLVSCWTVYDSLYDLFTRLAGSGKTTENDKPGKNRKLSEIFKNEGDRVCIHCGLDALMDPQYAWVFYVSYTFRNAFAHEGGRLNGEDILQGETARDYFKIALVTQNYFLSRDREFLRFLDKSLLYVPAGRSSARASGPSGFGPSAVISKFPWYNDDIREICKKYNAEIDDLFARMMVWAANSLKGQVEAFVGQISSAPVANVA